MRRGVTGSDGPELSAVRKREIIALNYDRVAQIITSRCDALRIPE